ncbi:MAG: molybdopterin-dependent oxidoreductase [Coriobacteriia bacterium]|nr:molybdopterin-dependent oxidoreductase [Coriobacteriia bacterium]
MSENEGVSSRMSVSRRSFVKTAAAAAGATALAFGPGQPVLRALAVDFKVGQPNNTGEKIFSCVCRPNCFGHCHLNVHVRDGKIVKTSRAPYKDENYSRICLRGLSHVQRVYAADRLKYPLRRVGARGEDKWERISWDEAIQEIATKFTDTQKTHGEQALSVCTSSGNVSLLHGLLGLPLAMTNVLHATSLSNTVDVAISYGTDRVFGAGGTVSREEKDYVNSKSVIAWGANVTEAQIHSWHLIADAMEGGTKLIVIDPVMTTLASKADRYVPIRPATDAALILSMMQVIFAEGLQNDAYLKKHTVAPFLIKKDGTFLRMSDLGVAPSDGPINMYTGKPTKVDPAAVWDTSTNAVIPAAEKETLQIKGPVTINGVAYRTALDLLKEEADKYPPSVATKITTVPEETIIELAHIAADQPVSHILGYGPQAFNNGAHATHAAATLCSILGNVGYPGASVGANWTIYPGVNWAALWPSGGNPSSTLSQFALRDTLQTGKFKGKDYPIKAMYVYSANPVCCFVNNNEYIKNVVNKLDFIVTADTFMTDTARYSDIVLPVAQWFEVQDIACAGQTQYMLYSEKAIDPLYESKSDGDIVRLITDKMGLGKYFQYSDDEFLTNMLKSDWSKAFGITFDTLKTEQMMRYMPDPYIPWEGSKFLSPSGRAEFYVEKPVPRVDEGQKIDIERERLPHFFPPGEAWPEDELYKKYPLVLLSERPRFRVHSTFYSVPWLRELEPEPIVKINPGDAEARGIHDGDHVEVHNDRGHAVAKAVFSEALMPGVMVYPKGWQMNQHRAGSWSELSSSSYDPAAVNQSFMDVLAEVRVWNGKA